MLITLRNTIYRSYDWSPKYYWDPTINKKMPWWLIMQREFTLLEGALTLVTLPIFLYNFWRVVIREDNLLDADPTFIVPSGIPHERPYQEYDYMLEENTSKEPQEQIKEKPVEQV